MPATAVHVFTETAREIADLAGQHTAALIAYSGGKDSTALLHLACQAFRKVVCFHMWFIPGLRCIEEKLDFARQRFGVEIRQYPHWGVFDMIKHGVYCPNNWRHWGLKPFTIYDVHRQVRADTGIDLILRGGKYSDSQWRRRMLRAKHNNRLVVDPLRDWNKWDVLAYLQMNGLPLPTGEGNVSSGVGLTRDAICWLYDLYPDDYAKMCAVFPYMEAAIHRRRWWNVGRYYTPEALARETQAREAFRRN